MTLAMAVNHALLESLWQGAVVAFGLSVALVVLRYAQARYIACCLALAALTLWPIATGWAYFSRPAREPGPFVSLWSAGIGAPMDAPTSIQWEQWALPLWLAGVAICSLRLLLGYHAVVRLRASGTAPEEQLLAAFRRMGGERFRIAVSALVDAPSVVGYWRPVVLVPFAALAGLSTQQLEGILAHELAHLRRGDHWVNMVQCWIEVVMFYHPAAWWISSRIRHERELCCDDAAVEACGDAGGYARALMTLEKLRMQTPQVTLSSNGGSLLYRIERLTGASRQGMPLLPALAALVCALALLPPSVPEAIAQIPAVVTPAPAVGNREPAAAPARPSPQTRPAETVLQGSELRAEMEAARAASLHESVGYMRDVLGTNTLEVWKLPEMRFALQRYGDLSKAATDITSAASPEARTAAEANAREILADVKAENARMHQERAALLDGTGRIYDRVIRAITFEGVPQATQANMLASLPNWVGQPYTTQIASNLRLVAADFISRDVRILLKREEGFEVTIVIHAPEPQAQLAQPSLINAAYQAPADNTTLAAEIRQTMYWAGWEAGYIHYRLQAEFPEDLEQAERAVNSLTRQQYDSQEEARLRQALTKLEAVIEQYRLQRIAIEGKDQRPAYYPPTTAL